MHGRALVMKWMYDLNFLETAICITGNLSAYVGRGYPQCIQAGNWGRL